MSESVCVLLGLMLFVLHLCESQPQHVARKITMFHDWLDCIHMCVKHPWRKEVWECVFSGVGLSARQGRQSKEE